MLSKWQAPNSVLRSVPCVARAALAIMFLLMVVATQPAQAQTFNVVYGFPGPPAGRQPSGPLAMDRAGSLYGLMTVNSGVDTLYRLSHRGSGWILTQLYTFPGGSDGFEFAYAVTPGPDGRLYGTSRQGGQGTCGHRGEFQGCGTIFVLSPPPTPCKTALCPWTKTIIYEFTGEEDGGIPSSELIFDDAGKLYGTAYYGGYKDGGICWAGCGTVYKLSLSGFGWAFQVAYTFHGAGDGTNPAGHPTFDNAGNFYGTEADGVFELMPSGSSWTEKVLYPVVGPYGVVFDRYGNLYGTAISYDSTGMVYQLTPAGGGWTETVLHVFTDGAAALPYGVTVNAAGDVDGALNEGGAYGYGYVFRLTPGGNGWTYSSLHDFTGGYDGQWPIRPLVLDPNGNLWGAAFYGTAGYGVIWEITP